MTSRLRPTGEVREPTSPELVLVAPPPLARAARERLPDPSVITQPMLLTGRPPATTRLNGPRVVVLRAPRTRAKRWRRFVAAAAVVAGLAALIGSIPFVRNHLDNASEARWRALGGAGNNTGHPGWGEADRPYLRIASVSFANGIGKMNGGPSPRYISNRIFNDVGQNLFSENGVTQWGWVWGQFLDHTFGLRNEKTAGERADPIRLDGPAGAVHERPRRDRLHRTPAAPGTGVSTPRQQINTVRATSMPSRCTVGPTRGSSGCARPGGRQTCRTTTRRSCFRAATSRVTRGQCPRQRRRRARRPMDLMGPLVGHPDERGRRRRRAREREHRAHRHAHAVRAGAQPNRLDCCPRPLRGGASSRSRGGSSAPSSSTSRTRSSSRARRPAPAVPGVRPDRQPDAHERVRDGRLPRAQHGPRRVRADGAGRAPTAGPARSVRAGRNRGGAQRTATSRSWSRSSLAFGNPDLLPADRPRAGAQGPRRRAAVQERRADRRASCAASCSRSRSPGTATRARAALRSSQPGCFSVVQDLGAIDIAARAATTACRATTSSGSPTGWRRSARSRRSPVSRRRASRGAARSTARDPIDDPDILDFSSLRDADGNEDPARGATRPERTPSSGRAARRSPRG